MQYGHGLPRIGSDIAHAPQHGSSSRLRSSFEQSPQSGPGPSNAARQTAQLHGKPKSITARISLPTATIAI